MKLQYEKREWLFLAATALLIGFILSFRLWGDSSFDINEGVENLVKTGLFAFISLLIYSAAMKLYGLRKGIVVTYDFARIASVGGLVITFLTNGILFFFSPGNIKFQVNTSKRVGRYGRLGNFYEFGYTVGVGIVTALIIAGLFSLQKGIIAEQFVTINLFIAFFSLIPIPSFPGFHMFANNLFHYAAIVGFTFAFAILLFLTNPFLALLFGLIGAIIGFFIEYNRRQKK